MPDSDSCPRLVLTTVGNPEEGARVGRILVEERLAACVTLVPGVQSIYRWQGGIEDAVETLLLIKTADEQLEALEERVVGLHSYQTPEFLVLNVDAGSAPYLAWLHACLQRT